MDASTTLGLGFLIIMSVIGWCWAFYAHKVIKMGSENCFSLPPALSILFGAWKHVDFRGMVLQTMIYIGSPLSALAILGKITWRQAIEIYAPVVFVLIGFFWVLFSRKR